MRSRRAALALWSLLAATPAAAQREYFFGTGKAPVYQEADPDRRFLRSRLYRALNEGTQDPNCQQLLAGLLTVLAETAPVLHKRDENFSLDPTLVAALQGQLSNQRFPGNAYLLAMMRRVLIDRRLPQAWLENATKLNERAQIIDLGKLRFLADGVRPVDSSYFTLQALKDRYELEVLQATRAANTDVAADFRDTYLDRDVAWGGLTLLDVGTRGAALKKGKGKPKPSDLSPEELEAHLTWQPPSPHQHHLMVFAVKPPPPVKVVARLAPQQYLDLTKLPKGKRMLVRGRLWETNKTVTEVELREALLFEDRDWSRGVVLADPQAVWACPFAQNDLVGTAPAQPGGFGQH